MLLSPLVSKDLTMFVHRLLSYRSWSSLYISKKSLSYIAIWPSVKPRACIRWVSVGEERCTTLSGGIPIKVAVTPVWALVDVCNTKLKVKLFLKLVDGVNCWDRKGFTSSSMSMESGSWLPSHVSMLSLSTFGKKAYRPSPKHLETVLWQADILGAPSLTTDEATKSTVIAMRKDVCWGVLFSTYLFLS